MLALSHHPFLRHLPPSSASSSLPSLPPPHCIKRFSVVRASMDQPAAASPVMGFPHLPPSHRDLMVDLLSTIEARLGPHLLPSAVPSNVLSFQGQGGASQGALDIRSGGQDSSVDFILESWLHCNVPSGSLNITTIFAFLKASTDAPHLLMEFIQGSPTSLILFMDLLPRKDLVLHPDYLDEFYQNTNLDRPRQELENVPQVLPYRSSSLYIRSVLSPTAVAVQINCGAEGESAMEEIMQVQLDSVAKEILRIWLDKCARSMKQLGETERADLLSRDTLIKNKTVEIDLAANLPRLFGPDVANRVVEAIQKAYRI
ncbi:red chlorophyll catabolite reductase-like [Elaeis guineensis]|uniref:Red chlorophyll catabolite reductase n=1 Tax=Elaeis guineensis var. tenera TaxID=51953 RepID=A0A6I9RGL8_ELAGV|nr:red chlorophyll catabolite reductase [Elaeis guineensis]